MITGIILSFFGLSLLASFVVFAACVASARADRIQSGAFEQLTMQAGAANEQQAIATPKLSLSANSI